MRGVWVREGAGWLAATALALIVAGQVASTARSEMLFRDGDSLIVAMFVRSLFSGEPLDWAMSSVLFIPESAVFVLLSALPLNVNGLLAVNAVVNVLGLYGALRLAAGRRSPGRAPVAWSVIALGVFGLIAVTETSASRTSFEVASLLLTTTYYSATVIAMIASIGIVRRALERPHLGWGAPLALAVIAAVSVLSNPLYAVWATAPLALLLAIGAWRQTLRRASILLIAALGVGSVLGMALRMPLEPWIMRSGAGYVQPGEWLASVQYYGDFALERLRTPLGILAGAVLLALIAVAVVQTLRVREPGARLVAASAWLIPLAVVVGGIALGTHATRYLAPAAFAPLLALLVTPRAVRLPRPRVLIAAVAAALLVAGVGSVPRLVAAAQHPDADLACVTDWVAASDRTGGGQFWTVRLPKLHADDPSQLLQLHATLDGYSWLVNRHDFQTREVTFLLEDAQSGAFQLPPGAVPDAVIECGRYRIVDFGSHPLPVGEPVS